MYTCFCLHDAVRKPLQPPYDSLYKVLQRAEKHVTLEIKGHREDVSLDILRPAYLSGLFETNASYPDTPAVELPPSRAHRHVTFKEPDF